MICILGFYKRKPGLTHEQFLRHWRDIHGPLVLNTPSVAKYIRKYLQHHMEEVRFIPQVEALPFDGFSETWCDSQADYEAMRAEPAFKQVMHPDVDLFIDTNATRVMMCDTPHSIK